MGSNIFELNVKDVVGAVASAIISALLMYLGNLTSVSDLDWGQVGSIAFTVGVTSMLKAFGSDRQGDLLGVLPVK